ncbi:hypothetical protein [Prevotella lacticifex]|uniref:hypothetical protein n=1 Tax=Prevotella lacticifex TaxID=2854755 RepID=UPI001CC7F8FD|nr:hypothetical protein [Prevotella lacticifex]
MQIVLDSSIHISAVSEHIFNGLRTYLQRLTNISSTAYEYIFNGSRIYLQWLTKVSLMAHEGIFSGIRT